MTDDNKEKKDRTPKTAVNTPDLKVNVLRTEGNSSLVEWHVAATDELKRAYIPKSKVINGRCSESVLNLGIPYGLPWSKIVKVSMTPESIQRELRRVGIWTIDDFQEKGSQVYGALNRASGVNLSTLSQATTEYLKKEGK